MKRLYLAFAAFCATVSFVYSLQCYKCGPGVGEERLSPAECLARQEKITCNATAGEDRCMNGTGVTVTPDGKAVVMRKCMTYKGCDEAMDYCSDVKGERTRDNVYKSCGAECCANNLCNYVADTADKSHGAAVTFNLLWVTLGVLCSLIY